MAQHVPLTERESNEVVALASIRTPVWSIGEKVGRSESCLHKRHQDLLDKGWAINARKLMKQINDKAMGKTKAGDNTMLIMLAKWHLGYREPQREIHATIDPAVLLAEIKAADAATFIDPPEETEG